MEIVANVQVPFKTKGRYTVETRNSVTKEHVEEKCFVVDNVVTLDGKHQFFTADNIRGNGKWAPGNKLGFGSGTTEILETDNTLGGTTVLAEPTMLTTVPQDVTGQSTLTAMTTVKRRTVFSPGVATGTWGQVGYLNNSTLLAGQVLRDGSGNPTTVTFLDIEEVTVTYTIELTYTYVAGYVTTDAMVTLGSTTAVVDGVTHTLTFLGLPGWAGAYTNNSVISDPDRGIATLFNKTSYDEPTILYKYSSDPDALDENWNYYDYISDSNPITVETLSKGSRYKISGSVTLPYTTLQGVYIKEYIHTGQYASETNLAYEYKSALGGMKIDPPLFKGAGYELTIGIHFIYELV